MGQNWDQTLGIVCFRVLHSMLSCLLILVLIMFVDSCFDSCLLILALIMFVDSCFDHVR